MVPDSASDRTPGSALLTARLHVDLCRLAGALCPRGTAA
ncbi:putative leader peptide [Streptomyces sp. NPDC002537]